MIKYQLICEKEHAFEAWFSNSSAYDDQLAAGYVECPICSSHEVRRALMAPNLNSPKTRKDPNLPALPQAEEVAQVLASADGVTNGAPQTDKDKVSGSAPSAPDNPLAKLSPSDQQALVGAAMTALRDMHKRVKKDFTNVGDKFADEARDMHYGDKANKPIYGTTTKDEREELEDEGIIYHHLPDLPPEQ